MTDTAETAVTVIALTRHGQTDWNAARRLQGSSDVPLNDIGREQAVASSARFTRGQWHSVVTSPLSRAVETGRIIADGLGIAVGLPHDDLRERHYGEAEGMTLDAASALWDYDTYPGIEDRDLVAQRGLGSLAEIAAGLPGASVIVVAHGTLIREVLQLIVGAPLPAIDNAATSIVESTGSGWRVLTVNGEPYEHVRAAHVAR
ncbi:MAG: histidine phosphatase family protein [Burkholderiaceae bacterium]|nr:histidine phosphatase family protein [Microbacteriaceae bacterium]